MRFIKLKQEEILSLEKIITSENRLRPIKRAQAILLSNKGEKVNKISTLIDVSEYRIYQWFNRYEEDGYNGLFDKSGRGRKSLIDIKNKDVVEKVVSETLSIKASCGVLGKKLAIDLKPNTLKYFLRKIGYSYKRLRHSPLKNPDKSLYDQKKAK
jgi:transposase